MKNLIKSQKKLKTKRVFNQAALRAIIASVKVHSLYQILQAKLGAKNLNRLITLCGLAALIFLLWVCNTHNHPKHDLKPPIPVVVAKIHKSDVPLYLNTIGTVTPLESIIVKSKRVSKRL